MQAADPLYSIPSRRQVMREILSGLYERTAGTIKADLQRVENITLTTDLWTSRRNQAYIGVMAHYVRDGKMVTYILATQHFKEDHTGVNISNVLKDIADEWGIMDAVKLVITDSAANMLLAMKLTPTTLEHLLNLVVKEAQKNDEALGDSIKKIKEIGTFVHHSTKASDKLAVNQKALNLPEHCLIQECETRWNSTLEMIERAIEQLPAIRTTLGQMGKHNMVLSDDEEKMMKEAVKNLRDFELVTSVFSGEKFATVSSLIPLTRALKMAMRNVEGRELLKIHLLEGLQKRFGKVEELKRVEV